MGFPDSSVGKESTCDAGDPGSIPGLGRSPEEGLGYPLQYSWASLVATHSSILAWRIPMDRGGWQATVHGVVMQYNEMQLSKSEKPNLCHS